ncbi:MAG: response regulator, partial [Boseongicola sp.]|nr:response regulator [Boseongicola sp.]
MTKGSILIIDDDREMRVSLTHLLETADFEVSSAKDGQEALSTLTERQRDAVLCDVRMPGMSGLEFLSKARDVSAAPIILISAHGDIPMAVDAIQGGAYSLLEQHFDHRRLLTILSNAVRMRQLE